MAARDSSGNGCSNPFEPIALSYRVAGCTIKYDWFGSKIELSVRALMRELDMNIDALLWLWHHFFARIGFCC